MRIQITSAAASNNSILTVSALKEHLRVTHTAEDSLIEAVRDAAVSYVEGYCNTKLHSVDATGYLSGFYPTAWAVGPVTEIESVKYQTTSSAAANDLTTLDASNYYLHSATDPAVISFINCPTPYQYAQFPVQVNFTYGYSSVPSAMVHAVRLLAAHLYENRQEVVDRSSIQIQMGVNALLSQYRYIVQP